MRKALKMVWCWLRDHKYFTEQRSGLEYWLLCERCPKSILLTHPKNPETYQMRGMLVEELLALLKDVPGNKTVVMTYEHDEWGESDKEIMGVRENDETNTVHIMTYP